MIVEWISMSKIFLDILMLDLNSGWKTTINGLLLMPHIIQRNSLLLGWYVRLNMER